MVGTLLGYIISYIHFKGILQNIIKYKIYLTKTEHSIQSDNPFLYKVINDSYLYPKLREILSESGLEVTDYKIEKNKNDSILVSIKMSKYKANSLIKVFDKYTNEFYISSVEYK